MPRALQQLLSNVRFYILVSSVSLSILLISWLRLSISSDILFYIRTEQVFGYLAIMYWYAALMVSPVTKAMSNKVAVSRIVTSRRAIGVSAAYFAALHILVALYGQIGGFGAVLLLPADFLWSFGLGTVAFVILFLMAATSFDKVIQVMTFTRWKWLHRLGYIGGILAMLHLWMIGTHLAYTWLRVIIFGLLALLFWLEAGRLAGLAAKKYPALSSKATLLKVGIWLLATGLLLMLPQALSNYNDDHHAKVIRGEARAV